MPLDPQVQAMIASTPAGKPVELMTFPEMRAASEARARVTAGPPQPVHQIVNRTLPGPGGPIRVRVYVPTDEPSLPALVYFHGGGWVRGSLETADVLCRALANGAGCVVVSVDYRVAPEHVFPTAVEDAIAATRWVADNAAELGVDPRRVAVGGDSAGGTLAAAVALELRDAGGPPLVYQLMIYPVTDFNLDTESYLANAEGYVLTRAAMRFYWQTYLADPSQADDQRASPLRAASHAGLPPALIITAEFDPLRDEGRAYASRLQAAGTFAELRDYAGMVHGFVASAGVIDIGKQAVQDAAAALRAAFANAATSVR